MESIAPTPISSPATQLSRPRLRLRDLDSIASQHSLIIDRDARDDSRSSDTDSPNVLLSPNDLEYISHYVRACQLLGEIYEDPRTDAVLEQMSHIVDGMYGPIDSSRPFYTEPRPIGRTPALETVYAEVFQCLTWCARIVLITYGRDEVKNVAARILESTGHRHKEIRRDRQIKQMISRAAVCTPHVIALEKQISRDAARTPHVLELEKRISRAKVRASRANAQWRYRVRQAAAQAGKEVPAVCALQPVGHPRQYTAAERDAVTAARNARNYQNYCARVRDKAQVAREASEAQVAPLESATEEQDARAVRSSFSVSQPPTQLGNCTSDPGTKKAGRPRKYATNAERNAAAASHSAARNRKYRARHHL
jgi:hypothetical protein